MIFFPGLCHDVPSICETNFEKFRIRDKDKLKFSSFSRKRHRHPKGRAFWQMQAMLAGMMNSTRTVYWILSFLFSLSFLLSYSYSLTRCEVIPTRCEAFPAVWGYLSCFWGYLSCLWGLIVCLWGPSSLLNDGHRRWLIVPHRAAALKNWMAYVPKKLVGHRKPLIML